MSSLSTPGGPLSASGAPQLADGFSDTFTSRRIDTGQVTLHAVVGGDGPPLLLVHGWPETWYAWRHVMPALARDFEVIAVDQRGIGLSDKPEHAAYEPRDHARRLLALLDSLHLPQATLVVHDFGGPIGLAAAIAEPERFGKLVLFNTWMWSVDGDPTIARGAKVAGSWFGRLLYRHANFPVKVLMPQAVGDKSVLTPEVHRHYAAPLGRPGERMGAWGCARALLQSGSWYDELWSQRDRLAEKPMLLLWGMRDPTFGPAYLERWRRAFPAAQVQTFPTSGHFVPEEVPGPAAQHLRDFLAPLA